MPVYNNLDGVEDSDNYAIEQSDGGEESLEYFNLVVRIVTIVTQTFFFQSEEIFVQLDELNKLDRITHE